MDKEEREDKLESLEDAKKYARDNYGLTFWSLFSTKKLVTKIKRKRVKEVRGGIKYKTHKHYVKSKVKEQGIKKHSHHYSIFASYADKVGVPPEFGDDEWHFETFSSKMMALRRMRKMERKGYHTVFYQSIANGAMKISEEFLSLKPISIARSVFHEGFHNMLYSRRIRLPLPINEAAASVVENYATIEYARQSPLLDIEEATDRKERSEKLKSLYLSKRKEIESLEEIPQSFYDEYTEEFFSIHPDPELYKARVRPHKINNAFFVHLEPYNMDYELVRSVYEKIGGLKDFIETIASLPNDYKEAKKSLEALL